MARADYVYMIFCGIRRDLPLGAFTVKYEMIGALAGLAEERSDLLVKRFHDGRLDRGVIMNVDDLLKEKR